MIELKKLRKVYRSLRGGRCVALNDIDLKLPDTGLVFIIGKSGSGKSTLLNLLGGLDTITDGDIVADGNSLASFTREDFEKYRSSYIGFVFQHYYLLEELTVAENVRLAMGIVGKDDEEEVQKLLEKVGLAGFGKRYPRELSGGQQQRVAIARALAKDPKLILGDELTGNLDHKTSVDILTVLKEISKEKLVVVVSHNLDEADMFADRIIELHDGEVVRDRIRVSGDQKQFFVKNRVVHLPYFRDLTKKEVQYLERELKNGNVRDIVQQDDGFALNTRNVNSDRQISLKDSKFVKKVKRKYAGIFVKKGLFTKLVTVVIVTLMLLCTSVFSSLDKIGYEDIKYTTDENYTSLIKGDLEGLGGALFIAYYHRVLDGDIAKVEELSGDKVYELISFIVKTHPNAGGNVHSGYRADIKRSLEGFYAKETFGTLICDEEFLLGEYGRDGAIPVVAGNLYNHSIPGVIITDYIADAYLRFQPEKYSCYDDILKNMSVTAIIDTDYKERYADIIARYDSYDGTDGYEELFLELSEEPRFQEFLKELIYTLGVTYTFNENFVSDLTNYPTVKALGVRKVTFEKDGVIYCADEPRSVSIVPNKFVSSSENSKYSPVADGEIKIVYTMYNQIFRTSYTSQNYNTFVPHEVTMRVLDKATDGAQAVYEKTFTVVGLYSPYGIQVTDDVFEEMKPLHVQTFGLYVKNNENIETVISSMYEDEMSPRTIAIDTVTSINKIMGVFIPLFKLISGGLYAFIVIYLINYAIQTIRKNYFQIGVFRSFGARSLDVGYIFITGVIITGLSIVVLMVALEPFIMEFYDRMLVESFAMVLNVYHHNIRIVDMSPTVPILNSLLVIITTAAAALISLLVMRKLKPIEIIRAKDNGGEVS